jgi:DNA replication and repair protein RecF
LLGHLPAGQVVITTASELPSAARADHVLRVIAGHVTQE